VGFAPTTWVPRSLTSGQRFGVLAAPYQSAPTLARLARQLAQFPRKCARFGDRQGDREHPSAAPGGHSDESDRERFRADEPVSVLLMSALTPRRLGLLAALALAALLAGCGKSGLGSRSGASASGTIAPVAAQGAVSVATKNTTRLGGADPASDAAAVARAVYPGLTDATRPQAVVIVDERNWPAALAASALASAPLGAPLLFSQGASLPEVSQQALEAMRPTGAPALGGAQVILIGSAAAIPGGLRTRSVAVPAADPPVAAAAVARLLRTAAGSNARQAIVLPTDAPRAIQMPAAGLAAESGAPILFVSSTGLTRATHAALSRLHKPAIYLLGFSSLPKSALSALARLGSVTPIAGASTLGEGLNPVGNAIAIARFTDGAFGWGVKEPGHGLVFASAARPLDAPAAALLSATGDYGPLLLLERPEQVPAALGTYLGDIQPAYGKAPQYQPVHGAYNHGWLIGDERAIAPATQAEIDAILEIVPGKAPTESSEESSATTTPE
jgi:hypothetical protein